MRTTTAVISALLLPAALYCATIRLDDPAFSEVVDPGAKLDTVATGLQFTEGPVWIGGSSGSAGYLLFSDIPADIIYRWSAADGLSQWRTPSGKSNGLLLDANGALLVCEHWGRKLSRVLTAESTQTICGSYQGKLLNSPNDVALDADGSLWFTDPSYGLEGREKEQPANYVFHVAASGGEPEAVADDFVQPNGIVFSPNKKVLYISDSQAGHVRKFAVKDGKLEDLGIFCEISPGGPDGMCVDVMGRLYVTAGDGVQVFGPDGTLLGRILTPQQPTNCCFGGDDMHTLYMTARPDVYSVRLLVKGLR